MAITTDDFNKIWASTSPLTPYSFSESQYKEGWNFIGSTPPSRQMWDFLQKNNDEKMQYLLNHFDNYLPLSGGTVTGVVNGVTPPVGDNSTKIATTEFVNAKAGLPVGFEYFTTNPNVPAGSLPLLGGEYSRETYADLWAWVQTQSGYLLEESAWQAKAAANGGNVPYYSSGDGSTTFRVPALKCWVRGANSISEVGGYLAAGLPNITGTAQFRTIDLSDNNLIYDCSNALNKSISAWPGGHAAVPTTQYEPYNLENLNIDASKSSAVYGKSSTVQPESIVGMWVVKAYGTIVDTGSIDEQAYIDDRIAALPNTFLPLAGGTMSGAIHYNGANNRSFGFELTNNNTNMDIGWNWTNRDGAGFGLRSTDAGGISGSFSIYARDGSNSTDLNGFPSGSLTWAGKEVERVNANSLTHDSGYIRYESGLQICWDTINVNKDYAGGAYETRTWTYPVAFNTEPIVLCNSRHDRFNVGTNNASIGNSSCTIYSVNTTPNSTFRLTYIDCVAIGRWK